MFPIVYILTPYAALFSSSTDRYIALFAILLIKSFAVMFGFPCVTILLTNSAASLRILGTLNGLATTFSAVGRAFGPALAGAAFSWGARTGWGIASWWLLAFMAALGIIPAFMIVEGAGPSASVVSSSSASANLDDEGEEEGTLLQDSAVVFDSESESESDSEDDDEGKDRNGRDDEATRPLLAGRSTRTGSS